MSSGQYFSAQPTAASRPGTVHLELADLQAELQVDRGVFSSSRVDPGTSILLRALPSLPSGPMLDLGCGYGPIACTLGYRHPEAEVWAVDVNERALKLTAANARGLKLRNVRTAMPESVPDGLRFAAIVSNPPIRVGKDALHQMLDQWLPRLRPDGEAWLVVHKHLGSDSLATWLVERGWNVERRASKQGYRILEVNGATK